VRVARIIASVTAVGFVLAVPGSVGAQTLPIRSLAQDSHAIAKAQVVSSKQQNQLHILSRSIARYEVLTWRCQDSLGTGHTRPSVGPWALPASVPYRRWVAASWASKKASCEHNLSRRTIPATNDWVTAVNLVQRVFPGTEAWLLSCSSAEGGHGRWVTYGGGSYYPGFENRYTVGGPLQYKWPTFRGHYRNALESLRSRGYIVDLPSPDDVQAWLSMTGQALAGGWARWSGNDSSHWSASWGNGC
jgi:hypothetical protein